MKGLWRVVTVVICLFAFSALPATVAADEEGQDYITETRPDVSALFDAHRNQVISVQTEMAGPVGDVGRLFGGGPEGEPARGEGSGFIVDAEGLAITNWHVVAGAQSIQVTTADGSSHPARLIGADPSTDIALLQIDSDATFEPAQMGDAADISPGQWVFAIGSPFGLEQSVTVGVLSAMGRQIGVGPYDDFLQTDAAINPGNSGGPLYNLDGEVIGVNTAIIPHGGGIGFAVPIDTVNAILPDLRDQGHVVRGFLGAGVQDMSPDLAETFALDARDGVLIRSVEDDGPAAGANIQEGDIITHVDGQRTSESAELLATVGQLAPGETVDVDFIRGGETYQTRVEVAERPDPQREEVERTLEPEPITEPGRIGVVLRAVDSRTAQQLELPPGAGVYVDRIEAGSPASGVLHRGDIILEVGDTEVREPSDVPAALREEAGERPIRMLVHRDGEPHYVAVRVVTE